MHRDFKRLLETSEGISEWVVAVNLDVRDFTSYTGVQMEAVQASLFLKTIYMKLLDSYFPDASFFKSTGDGLLVITTYPQGNLAESLQRAVVQALRALGDFAGLTKDEAEINFPVPKLLGIGISHGAASRLKSGTKTLDYFGRPINLASRLMDLARPSGLVIEDIRVLDANTKKQFASEKVYVRGIAEEDPMPVYYTKETTIIPMEAKVPILEPTWRNLTPQIYTYRELKNSPAVLGFFSPERPLGDRVDVQVGFPSVGSGGRAGRRVTLTLRPGVDYFLVQERGNSVVRIDPQLLASLLANRGIKETWTVIISVAYPEKPKPPKRRARAAT